jgi:predicted HicB family RNase H-like nuclease
LSTSDLLGSEEGKEGSMNLALQYMGFDGSVEYSEDDRVWHGTLRLVRDAVVYGGADLCSLERNFRASVDEYVAFCAMEGKTTEEACQFDTGGDEPFTFAS